MEIAVIIFFLALAAGILLLGAVIFAAGKLIRRKREKAKNARPKI